MSRQLNKWVLLVAIAAAAIVGSSCRPGGPGPMTGDERPPIIISDGSIDLFIDHPSPGKNRGKWAEVNSGTNTVLTHEPSGRPNPVTKFAVYLANAKNDTDGVNCDKTDWFYDVTTLTANYKKGNQNATIVVNISNGNLVATLEYEDSTYPVADHWKSTKGNEKLETVVLGGETCKFQNKRGIITIVQIY
jgi:hypothetical protein